MELYTAERELAVRLYRWSIGEYRREREHGYPLLRAIGNRGADIFLRLVWPLTREQEALLATALLKHAHPKALQHLGETPTEEERTLTERYFVLYRQQAVHGKPPPGDFKHAGSLVARRRMVVEAIRALKSMMGKPDERDGYDSYYVSRLGDWVLTTNVSSGRASFNCTWMLVRSDHSMSRFTVDNRDPMGHDHSFDYTSLLGMFTETSWEDVTEAEVEPAIDGLTTVCFHLLREIPPLLKGLSIDAP